MTPTQDPAITTAAAAPLFALQERLNAAAAGRSRSQLARIATAIAGKVWPSADVPSIDPGFVRDLQGRLRQLPGDGRAFRAVLAAHGVPLVEALRLNDYWPDLLPASGAQSTVEILAMALRNAGIRGRIRQVSGMTVVFELE